MKIKVERRHLREGVPEDETACPVALAIKEQVDWARDVEVDGLSILVRGETGTDVRKCPREIAEYVEAFDNGENLRPREFETWDFHED